MSDPFESPKLRLARAKEHFENFNAERSRFFEGKPWTWALEVNPQTFNKEGKVRADKIPDRFVSLAIDAIEGFRSTLDQCTFAIGRVAGITRAKYTHFPFGNDANGLEKQIHDRSRDLPSDILSLIRSLKPYRTGNDLLWAINAACNVSKHELLTPFAVAVQGQELNLGIGGGFTRTWTIDGLQIHASVWNSEKREIKFFTMGPKTDLNGEVKLALDISFGEIKVIKRKSVLSVLHEMLGMVDGVLVALESETRRLFPKRQSEQRVG